jgi:hypothetical protein
VFDSWWSRAFAFVAAVMVLNSRPGRGLEDAGSRSLARSVNWLQVGLVDGLVRLIVQLSKALINGLEYVLYTVDEWLRFRGGEGRLSMFARAAVGVVWFPVSYIARFYIVVLIEPGYNPLKAPVSWTAAKFVTPTLVALKIPDYLQDSLELLFVPTPVAFAIAWFTAFHICDVFGFFFWEMKENWRLYRANRPATLQPAIIGTRGETMLQLLNPGFHSGTLPKLFAQLRRAEREALETGAWRSARTVRERLRGVDELLRRFVIRDVLALLHLSPEWHKKPLGVGAIGLASNQVRIGLRHADYPDISLRVAIAEEDGKLVASLEEPGWLSRLTPAEARTLDQGIAGMYKLAAVDLVRKPMPPPAPGITTSLLLPEAAHPNALAAPMANGAPQSDGQVIVFHGVPFRWVDWVDWWRRDRAGEAVPPPVWVLPGAPHE